MMAALRFVAVAALAVWVGGLVALAATAEQIFGVLQARDGIGGREAAGLVFGAVFGRFQIVSWVAGGLVIASLGARAALGPRPRRMAWRIWIVAAMVSLSLVTSFILMPRIDAARSAANGPVAALAADNPVRIEFGRLHAASSVLALVIVLAGLGLIWAEIRDQH